MTKMLRWIRGFHHQCKAPLYLIYEGCKHIATYANERACNMLASTLQHLPDHPLIRVLRHTPTAKLTAGRFFLLRNQFHTLLNQLGESPESRTARWESEAYEKARIRNEKTHLAHELALSTRSHPIDEDKPLTALPRYRVKQFRTIAQRLDYLIEQGIAQESAKLRIAPAAVVEAPREIATLTFAIVITKIESFFWSCAYCAEDPRRSKLLTSRERSNISRKDAMQALINDCLREYPGTPITIISSNKKAIVLCFG